MIHFSQKTALSFENFIARRYLITPRKHRSVTIITRLSIIGVALGVMTLIVVLSVMNGFEKDLKGALQGANGHLNLYGFGSEGVEWQKGDGLLDPLRKHKEVKAISPFTTNQALIMGKQKPIGSMIKGIDLKNEPKVSKILFNIRTTLFQDDLDADPLEEDSFDQNGLNQSNINIDQEQLNTPQADKDKARIKDSKTKQKSATETLQTLKRHKVTITDADGNRKTVYAHGILLGSQLAKNLGVTIGDFVTLVSPQERITPMGSIPRAKKFLVTGYFESGIMGYDEVLAYIDLEMSQKMYRMTGRVTGFTIQLHDASQTEQVREDLFDDYLFPFWFTSWKDQNANLFAMFQLEKLGLAIILTLIIIIAAFNIISSLIMLVTEKKKDIAILKAIGAKEISIQKIFVTQGAVIGLTGTIIGEILGLCLCWVIASFDLIDIPAGVYVGNRIPMHIEIWQIATIAVVSLIICFGVTLIPSRNAAKLHPVDGLRNE